MEVLLHIGTPKTGSTSIQDFLVGNREALAGLGHYYPTHAFAPARNFSALIIGLTGGNAGSPHLRLALGGKDAIRNSLSIWDDIATQIKRHKPRQLILSAERFISLGPEGIKKLLQNLAGLTPSRPRAVCYVREPAAKHLSKVQERLKGGWGPHCRVIPHGRQLRHWRSAIGSDLTVVKFDRVSLHSGDVVRDFARIAGIEDAGLTQSEQHSNVSVSAEVMSVLERLTSEPPVGLQQLVKWRKTVRALKKLDFDLPSPTRPALFDEVAERIRAASDDIEILSTEFGIQFDEVDYKTIGTVDPWQLIQLGVDELCSYSVERRDVLESRLHQALRE